MMQTSQNVPFLIYTSKTKLQGTLKKRLINIIESQKTVLLKKNLGLF